MEQIGEYIVRRLVGEGGMGKVYEAEERLSKRRVALKVLRDELARSESARGLFLNEMQILAHLEHPNIVRSLACFEADTKLVTVLEFLEGKTLRELLNARGRLPWEDAVYVVVSVAKALMAAHGQTPPVIHRDLKPENIMVLGDGTVKVMDFGIAKLIQALNQTNTQSVGTLQYMSPEQIDAQTVDQRSDLYCLGLVFYELLAGKPPFHSSSPRQLLNMQCTEPPPKLDEAVRAGLSKGIQKLLFSLLSKEPDQRPQSAAAVVERLEEFLPDRSFAGLADPDADRLDVPVTSERSPSSASGPRHDTMPSEGSGAGTAARSLRDDEPASRKRTRGDKQRKLARGELRKDTVALIDQASNEREISTRLSLVIILLLMVMAGIGTYVWRSSQTADTETQPAAPAATDQESASD
jgi:serine/threonine-protein kinase